MSVYKPARSPFWHFDFVIQRRRFHGSTGQATRRGAEAAERRLRLEAAEGRLGEAAGLSLDQAAGRWWAEVGCRRRDAADVERRLENLLALLGRATRLADIGTPQVSAAVQKRLGQSFRRGDAKRSTARLPANATVNRDVIETLRPILRRAATHWGARGLPAIAWKDLRLAEPAPRARAYSAEAQAAWLDACGEPERLALQILLTYGLRFGELFFAPAAFDAGGPRLSIEKRKRDVPLVLPLRADDGAALAARVRLAADAGLPHVWATPILVGPKRGRLRCLTYHELKGRLERAADRAGVPPGRRLHGARHHAGTMAVRASGSLWLAQQLLGHADAKSTQRYAHVAEADLRGLVDALPRNGPGRPPARSAKRK